MTNPDDPPPSRFAARLDTLYGDTTPGPIAVVDGAGVSVRVWRGHLEVNDGLGRHRRTRTWPRAGHALRHLLVLGRGTITTEALSWCADVGARVTILGGDRVIAAGPYGTDDARLRRAQAVAGLSAAGGDHPAIMVGRRVVADLVNTAIGGRAELLIDHFHAQVAADEIGRWTTSRVDETIEAVRGREAAAARVYFRAWRGMSVTFATRDRPRIPAHWQYYTQRTSPNTSGHRPNNAADPVNALLNYGYRLAEVECVHACYAVGLDPGLGILHQDRPGRQSMALDLLEAVRPQVERWVLDTVANTVFTYDDFIETRDGTCRLLPPLTHLYTETMPLWAKAVAPWAEHVAHALGEASGYRVKARTPLTEAGRRGRYTTTVTAATRPTAPATPRRCADSGRDLPPRRRRCPSCHPHPHRTPPTSTPTSRRA